MNLRARSLLVVLASIPLAIVAACGSSDESSSSSSNGGSGSADAARDTGNHDPSKNCVKPGTPNNADGIGGYCLSNSDCVVGKSLCTGEFGAPPDAWFCTRICADDPRCGDGLTCVKDTRGVACIPNACLALDGGSDASTGSDSAADVTTD